MYNYKIKTSFVSPCLRHLGANKTNYFSMAQKPINIRWIINLKIMCSIVLYPIFDEY